MCFALFIASIAFFLGGSRVPEMFRHPAVLAAASCCRSSPCCTGCGASAPDESLAAWLSCPHSKQSSKGSVFNDHQSDQRTDFSETAPAVARRLLAIALVLARYVVPLFAGEATIFEFPVALLAIFAGMGCAVAIVVWWMFFSRAQWSDRLGALLVMIAALVAIKFVVHRRSPAARWETWLTFWRSRP